MDLASDFTLFSPVAVTATFAFLLLTAFVDLASDLTFLSPLTVADTLTFLLFSDFVALAVLDTFAPSSVALGRTPGLGLTACLDDVVFLDFFDEFLPTTKG